MHPILIKIGPLTIHTYGFLLAVGVLCGIMVSLNLAKRAGLDTRLMSDFIFFSVLIGLVGAKIWLFVTEIDYYMADTGRIPSLLTAAGTFYGGLIFGLLFVIWFVRRKKLDMKIVGDTLAPGVALAHFFGRLGCFFAGCCWGREALDSPIAVRFSDPNCSTDLDFRNVPVYPVQLIESLLNLLNFIVLFVLFKKKKYDGQVFALYMFNYSIIRFIVEYFRGDNDRGYILGGVSHPFSSISVPQVVSIIGVTIAIILFIKFRKSSKREA